MFVEFFSFFSDQNIKASDTRSLFLLKSYISSAVTMRRRLQAALVGAVVLGSLPSSILAHGGESMNMDHGQAMVKAAQDSDMETYFSYPEYQSALYAHIALMIVSWVFMLPVGKSLTPEAS